LGGTGASLRRESDHCCGNACETHPLPSLGQQLAGSHCLFAAPLAKPRIMKLYSLVYRIEVRDPRYRGRTKICAVPPEELLIFALKLFEQTQARPDYFIVMPRLTVAIILFSGIRAKSA
jgi:hypothetical protein